MQENQETKGKIDVLGLGIDIAKDYSQVSFMTAGMAEPDSMSLIKDEKRYLIPTALYKLKNLDAWCIGEEAVARARDDGEEGVNYAGDFIELAAKGKSVVIEGVTYEGTVLFCIYMEKLMEETIRILNINSISHIAITMEKVEKSIADIVYDKFESMGYERDNVRLLSHTEAFIYYTINQKRELWVNDVVLFDFNTHEFTYRKINIIKNKVPQIIKVQEEEFSKLINLSYLKNESDRARLDEKFLRLIKEKFGKNVISSVFLTGVGFYDEWTKDSIKELCNRRRVFKGYNLLVKGACYAAMKRYKKIDGIEHIFCCDGRTKANIGVVIKHKGKNMNVLLSRAGSNWYEAGAKIECIVDNTNKVQCVLSSIDNTAIETIELDISGFPKRENKATRVEIVVSFSDDDKCTIAVKDMGFGEFFKASEMMVKKSFLVSELFG